MATQQLMFDILATAKGVDKTFNEVAASADSMAGKLGAAGAKASEKLFSPMTAAAAGGIAGAALMTGLRTAIDRNSATSQLQNQLNLPAESAETAGAAAGELYNQGFGDSFESVSSAIGDVMSSISGMSSASQADLQKVAGSVMAVAQTFEIDTARAAQVAGQMITTGLAKDGVQAADLLSAALQKVPANVREDVLDAVDEYGPMFAQLGFSGEQAMTMLADASAKGSFGIDKTGDALKEFTIMATDMSTATGDAYKSLGMDQTEMTNKLLAGGADAETAFNDIVAGLTGIEDPAAQSQAALALFGTPLEDLGTDGIPKFLDSLLFAKEGLGEVDGASQQLADNMNSGPAAAFTTFQRTAESTLGELGAQILPILTPILEGLAQFAPIIGPAVIALGALAAVIAIVNFVMALNPVTWIIVGIVALIAAVVALVMNWEQVAAFLTGIWQGFVSWITGVTDGFVGWWNGLWAGFFAWTSGLWSGFTGWVTGIFAGFIGWIMGLVAGFVAGWNASWAAVGAFIGGIWSGIVSGASSMASGLMDFISGIPGSIIGFFSGAGQWLWDAGVNIVQGLLSGVSSLAGTIGSFFLNLMPGWIVGPFKAALGIASPSKVFDGFGQNIGEGVLGGVGKMQDEIDDRMSNLVTVPEVPDVNPGGTGTGSGAGGSGNGTGGAGQGGDNGGLTEEDRQLLRDFIAAAERPLVATVNGREFLTAVRESEKKGKRH
ncbi:phage tail tape measure protein [Pseudarthrobacter sp. J64]|uniref:phage tail tape measure protein n=1 Tax=Pseudarthrobacter sp. J64 TaxID=3116485 RepID=UPI002E7FDD08|nr:phage tail tape measure protein [Pseudarthrobacter sp. J64]MEE2568608.1 phage tail tape measure protein [Pseudarthrobacter sp. J64]